MNPAAPADDAIVTVPPASVNFVALPSRFQNTCRSRTGSPTTECCGASNAVTHGDASALSLDTQHVDDFLDDLMQVDLLVRELQAAA